MKNNTVIKLIDDRGRISIPLSIREALQFEAGDILKLEASDNKLIIRKVAILDLEGQSEQDILAVIHNAVSSLSKEKKLHVATQIIKLIERME